MGRNFLLIASVIAAAAFLAWLAWVTPGGPTVTPGSASTTLPGPASESAAVSSGFAAAPAVIAPASPPAQAEVATPTSAPPEVLEATDRRQSAKITRGMSSNPQGGIRIDAVPPGSVAGQMHLLPGDVLMAVNGTALSSPEDFVRLYRAEGVQGEFVVIRDGREIHRR